MSGTTDDNDLVAYVTGGLDEAARLHFEQRLVVDADLAARLLDYESSELIAAVALRAGETAMVSGRRRPTAARGFAMLAAAAAIALVYVWWPAAALRCELRLVASLAADEPDAYASELGWSDPAGRVLVRRRGEPAAAALLPVAEFLAAVQPLEAARGNAAMAAPVAVAIGDFVTVRLRPSAECSAVVLQLDASGGLRRVFPTPSGPVFGEVADRLSPDALHTLPRPVILPNAIGGVSLHGGFDVAGDQHQARSWFLVGVRREPVSATTWAEIDARLVVVAVGDLAGADPTTLDAAAAQALQPVVDRLTQSGFTVSKPMAASPHR